MNAILKQTCLVCFALSVSTVAVAETGSSQMDSRINLAGQWQVRLDPDRQYDPAAAPDRASEAEAFQPVQLPGALRDSGLGDPVGPSTQWIAGARDEVWNRPEYRKYQEPDNFKTPNWLQPLRHYVGVAYYQRSVVIPEGWRDQRVVLALERPHWQTQVWVDGNHAGKDDSLSTPHVFDLTRWLSPGQHTLTIGVDNSLHSLDVGINSHSVSDHTQSAWHGIVGKIELRAEPKMGIEDVQVSPAKDARSLKVTLRLRNNSDNQPVDTIVLRALQEGQLLGQQTLTITGAIDDETKIDCSVPLDRPAKRWDEFQPNLCRLQVSLFSGYEGVTRQVVFGIRHIATKDTQFLLNDRPLFLRGTLECCIFPLTGYPPTDVDSWKRIVRVCKSHGLNHIRFHSWCPPEAAFVAADELGFYFQVECSTWPNVSTKLGKGLPIDQWLYREGGRVLTSYGNHPSFLLLAMGNEPAGEERGGKYLGPWVEHFKAQTDRQLVTSGAGWPSIVENEFHVTPRPRIQQWGQGLTSRINAQPPDTMADYREFVSSYDVPVISHEIGQWCVYPNFGEIPKYSGALKPRNFEIFRDLLADAQMLDQAHDFLFASGKLQALCYKEEIESALRTPRFGGFQLLDLHDFPGQGTALVGVLDPFWDSKPYITPAAFRRFCGPTVPLARLPKRTWTNQETLVADIEVSHFGPEPLRETKPRWIVKRDGKKVAEGTLAGKEIPCGALTSLGRIELPLQQFTSAAKLTLEVSVAGVRASHANDWDLFVYPQQEQAPATPNLLVVRELNQDARRHLKNGGKVLLLPPPETVDTDIQIGFSSIFWNTSWTSGQPPHTLGILCNRQHPAFQEFPTDNYSNWQWWELISRSRPMVMDQLATNLHPLVQVVPDWFRPQKLGLLFEANVANGKLLVCTIDLTTDLQNRPVARQLRRSLLKYVASKEFSPTAKADMEAMGDLFREPTTLQRIGAEVSADDAHDSHPPALAIDGDPETIWHTDWEPTPSPMPHWLLLDLGQPHRVRGIRCTPRQDQSNGRIAEYAIHVSNNNREWGPPVAVGEFAANEKSQLVQFAKTHSARYVKLVARREVNGKPYASLAEIDVVLDGELFDGDRQP